MSKNLSDNVNELSEVTKKYVQTRIELLKLSVLSKVTQVTSYFISTLVLITGVAMVVFFCFAAFVAWYGQVYHDYLTGLLLVIGVLVVLVVLFALLKKQLVTSLVLRKYSSLLFDDEEEEVEL
ncbi:phage holin family protein [uncultured Sunxiuqinia sp.]|uniref:phage holin family protein n=1 Tax=Sunxiuqinia rutila TaxID=1397841 RepID=UPI00261B105F|nr:phage holin family protein [uncultured Sunxiuqinia sp.]